MMCSNVENYVLVAKMRLTNLKTVIHLLKAINFKETAICVGSKNELKITVDAKCVQTSAYIPSVIFHEFNLNDDVTFSISLNILIEYLCMFWPSAQEDSVTVQIFYKATGYSLSIITEEDSVITDCSLKTLEIDTLPDFHLEAENLVNKVVLQTELLKGIITELDPTSDLIELRLSPEKPYFRISTDGLGSVCHIDLPHDSDRVDTFQCTSMATSNFKLAHIKPAVFLCLLSVRIMNLCRKFCISPDTLSYWLAGSEVDIATRRCWVNPPVISFARRTCAEHCSFAEVTANDFYIVKNLVKYTYIYLLTSYITIFLDCFGDNRNFIFGFVLADNIGSFLGVNSISSVLGRKFFIR